MMDWHRPQKTAKNKKVCAVCVAGACIAGTMAHPVDKIFDPWGHDDADADAVASALDDVRSGDLVCALENLRGELVIQYDDPTFAPLEEASNTISFDFSLDRDRGRAKWSTYLKAASMLEKAGL